MTSIKLVTIVVSIAVVSSCGTYEAVEDWQAAPLGDVSLEQIRNTIHEGNPSVAIQDLSALRRSSVRVPADQIDVLFQDATQELKNQFEESVEEGNYSRALSLYRSAEIVGAGDLLVNWSVGKLQRALVNRYFELEQPLLALMAMRDLFARESVSAEELSEYVAKAGDTGHERLLKTLVRSASVKSEISDSIVGMPDVPVPTTEEMVSGTVTVLVNRGIRLENNVGYPDQVVGSGFFVDRRGYLLTNYHVIRSEVDPEYEGFSRLYVQLPGSEYERLPATVVGWDPALDLALLKVAEEPDFVFSPNPDPDFSPGDRIIAIGSPAGLNNSVSSGIVSATGRRFLQLGEAMQVDVPINPGSSGGPLIGESGKLVGVVFAGIEQFEGINFAIPSDWIWHALPRLYEEGSAEYPWMGVSVHEWRDALTVKYVVPGSPGYRAGLQLGDRITSINGVPMTEIAGAQDLLLRFTHESLVKLTWERNGASETGFVALGLRPARPMDVALERDLFERLVPPLFGMVLEKTGRVLWETSYVVRDVFAGTLADETGLSVGDPLTIRDWNVDADNRVAVLRIVVKKRKAGFIERVIQLAAYLEIDSFL